jgi:hypothetical protein
MKTYCYECNDDKDVELLEKEVTTTIDTITFIYSANIAKCKICGNEVYIPEISDQNLKRANDKYCSSQAKLNHPTQTINYSTLI